MRKYTVIRKSIAGNELGVHHYDHKADVMAEVSAGYQVEVMKYTVYLGKKFRHEEVCEE